MTSSKGVATVAQETVYVYETPVRLWHWINAFAILVLAVTGYFIGQPLPSVPGEAVDNFLMGYIRFAHFAAGYVMIVGFLLRVYWAIVGNSHARQIFLPPIFNGTWWAEVWPEVKWYAFIAREPKKYVGHNPLATLTMHIMIVWGLVFMMATGLALYGEGAGMGSWQYQLFSSWIIPLLDNSQDLHTFHRLGLWWIVCFVIIHIYVAIREDIMSRQSIVSTMISGWRMFKDHRPVDDPD